MLKTDAYYRDLAAGLLHRAGVVEAPVDLRAVARTLGVPIRPVRLADFFSGMIVSEDGMPVFVLNVERGAASQRATLAHMIGHVVVMLDDQAASYPRDTGDHGVADVVGAEIGMPEYLVVEESRKWFNDHRYLARLFGVSEGEMTDRMRQLGLITDRGIHWEY